MKKLLILTTIIMTGGLTLPAAAQSHRSTQTAINTVFISGYLHCGTPIYSKRVQRGQHYHTQRLTGYELQRYLKRQRKTAYQKQQRNRYQSHKGYRNTGRR